MRHLARSVELQTRFIAREANGNRFVSSYVRLDLKYYTNYSPPRLWRRRHEVPQALFHLLRIQPLELHALLHPKIISSVKLPLCTARLTNQHRRRRRRSLQVFIARHQEIPNPFAPFARLAQVKAKFLHSLEPSKRGFRHATGARRHPLVVVVVCRSCPRAPHRGRPRPSIGSSACRSRSMFENVKPRPRGRARRTIRLSAPRRTLVEMANTSCTIRTRKFMTNRLLQRRQFVRIDVARATQRRPRVDSAMLARAAVDGIATGVSRRRRRRRRRAAEKVYGG